MASKGKDRRKECRDAVRIHDGPERIVRSGWEVKYLCANLNRKNGGDDEGKNRYRLDSGKEGPGEPASLS